MSQSVMFVVIDGICTQRFQPEVVVGCEKLFNFLCLYTRKAEISTTVVINNISTTLIGSRSFDTVFNSGLMFLFNAGLRPKL